LFETIFDYRKDNIFGARRPWNIVILQYNSSFLHLVKGNLVTLGLIVATQHEAKEYKRPNLKVNVTEL